MRVRLTCNECNLLRLYPIIVGATSRRRTAEG